MPDFRHESQLLPCTVHPRPDELLSSWLVRLAHRHFSKSHTFCSMLFPGTSIWNRDIDKIAPDSVINSLAERTLAPIAHIRDTTLRSYEGRLYLNHNPYSNTPWIMPLGIYHRSWKNFGLQFCPGCLTRDGDSPYFRKKWRLSLSVVCPTCSTLLLDRCPWCNQPVCFFRNELGQRSSQVALSIATCYACKKDLRRAHTHLAPDSLLMRQQQLYDFIEKGYTADLQYSHLYFDVLYHVLGLLTSRHKKGGALQKAICVEAGLPHQVQQGGFRDNFDRKGIAERVQLLEQAFWLQEEWPDRFTDVCRRNRIWSNFLLKDKESLPYWYQSIVMEELHIVFTPWRDLGKPNLNSYSTLGRRHYDTEKDRATNVEIAWKDLLRTSPIEQVFEDMLGFKDIQVCQVIEEDKQIEVHCKSKLAKASCIYCLKDNVRKRNTLSRKLRDLSINGKAIWLCTTIRQYKCRECNLYFQEQFSFINGKNKSTPRYAQRLQEYTESIKLQMSLLADAKTIIKS